MGETDWYGLLGRAPRLRPGASAVCEGLVVGEYPGPHDAPWLRDAHGITAVVSVQDDGDLKSKGLVLSELERAYREHGIAFHRLPVPDGDGEALAARLDDLLPLLARLLAAGERVYLHCNAGFNRAPTIAIAHLHANGGLPLAEARAEVAARRSCMPYMTVLEAYFRAGRSG